MANETEALAAWRDKYRHTSRKDLLLIIEMCLTFLKLRTDEIAEVLGLTKLSREAAIEVLAAIQTLGGPETRMPKQERDSALPVPQTSQDGDLPRWAIDRIRTGTDDEPTKVARGQTYATRSGVLFHLRTARRHPRGSNQHSYWFGLAEDKWIPGQVFVLACDTDALLIVPVEDWLPYRDATPISTSRGFESVRQPTIWQTANRRFELRVGGQHIDATRWIDNFDAL